MGDAMGERLADAAMRRRAAAEISARRQALELAIGSFTSDQVSSGDEIVQRARKFQDFLLPVVPAERPHHPCGREGCVTPSGKTACHTCGEAWPCSRAEA